MHTHIWKETERSFGTEKTLLTCILPKNLLGSGFSTPYTPFCWVCTVSSELKCIFYLYTFESSGVDIRDFQWTGSTPAGFQAAFCAACILKMSMHNESRTRTYTPRYTLINLCMHSDSPTHLCTMSKHNESRTRTYTPKYTLINLCMHSDSPSIYVCGMHTERLY